jgi:hypothetical protein
MPEVIPCTDCSFLEGSFFGLLVTFRVIFIGFDLFPFIIMRDALKTCNRNIASASPSDRNGNWILLP